MEAGRGHREERTIAGCCCSDRRWSWVARGFDWNRRRDFSDAATPSDALGHHEASCGSVGAFYPVQFSFRTAWQYKQHATDSEFCHSTGGRRRRGRDDRITSGEQTSAAYGDQKIIGNRAFDRGREIDSHPLRQTLREVGGGEYKK